MKPAYGYLRVSDRSQLDGDGFPRQRAAIEQYAREHDIRIVRWFEEKGVSGTLTDRPALAEMIALLHANGTKLVIVEKLDRLARDLMVQETIIGDLRKAAVELISTMEPDLCSDDPSRKLIRQMFGAIAEYERAMIVAKLRGARDRMRAKIGRCEGRKAYGHSATERLVLKRIQSYLNDGHNFSAIAEKLNHAGIKTRYGSKWLPNTVRRIALREKQIQEAGSVKARAGR